MIGEEEDGGGREKTREGGRGRGRLLVPDVVFVLNNYSGMIPSVAEAVFVSEPMAVSPPYFL